MKHQGYNNVTSSNANNVAQKIEFNGKEYQDELSLNVVAMDWRQYDSAIARFMTVDPLSEEMYDLTPYHFSYNNPILFADPSGLRGIKGNPTKTLLSDLFNNSYGNNTFWNNNNDGTFSSGSTFYNVSQREFFEFTQDLPELHISSDGGGLGGLGDVVRDFTYEHGYLYKFRSDLESDSDSVGQPGTLESFIPIWGSGRAAVDHFQNGNYWQGAFYTALAVSDVFLVESIVKGVTKGGISALGKSYKNWTSWRKLYGQKGFADKGQHLHHWLLKRNGQKSGSGLAWKLKNQMWNLMPMKSPAFHIAIHGKGANPFNMAEKMYYGTPSWFKTSIISTLGHSAESMEIDSNEE